MRPDFKNISLRTDKKKPGAFAQWEKGHQVEKSWLWKWNT
jgi:hypothetical protein